MMSLLQLWKVVQMLYLAEQLLGEKQKLKDREDTDDSKELILTKDKEHSLAITARSLAITRRTTEISSTSVKWKA